MKLTIILTAASIYLLTLLTCSHTSKSLITKKYTEFSNQSRVNPNHYKGVPAVILQNDYIVSILPNGHTDIKNTQYIQLLQNSDSNWLKSKIIAGKNASGLEWSGRVINKNGKIERSIGSAKRSNPFKPLSAASLYPAAKQMTIKESNLKAGQVIQISNTIHWEDARWLPNIYLSDRLPVKKATLIVNAPEGMAPNIQISQNGEPVEAYPQVFPATFPYKGESNLAGNQYVMVIHDPPNFLENGQEFSTEGLATQAQISLVTGKTNRKPVHFNQDQDIGNWFLLHVHNLNVQPKPIRDLAEKLTKASKTKLEKIDAILKYGQNIETLPAFTSIGSTHFQQPINITKAKRATSRDIAILLYALLDSVNIKSQFVLVPAGHTKPQLQRIVTPASIDGVLLRVKTENGHQLIDPTQRNLAAGKVSPPYAGREGLLLSPRSTSRIRLP